LIADGRWRFVAVSDACQILRCRALPNNPSRGLPRRLPIQRELRGARVPLDGFGVEPDLPQDDLCAKRTMPSSLA
jgi:hypothetical protein